MLYTEVIGKKKKRKVTKVPFVQEIRIEGVTYVIYGEIPIRGAIGVL